ncbi:MAG: hypothetical protein ACF8GE_09620 [Phycisphaerales bacterium JB043]
MLAVPVHARGKTVRCRFCATNIRIPTKSASTKSAPPTMDQGEGESTETAA